MRYSVILLLALAGCGGRANIAPAVQARVVTTTVEVQRPCPVTVPKRPTALALPLPNDALAAEIERRHLDI